MESGAQEHITADFIKLLQARWKSRENADTSSGNGQNLPGGGNSNMFYVHPENWGKMNPI